MPAEIIEAKKKEILELKAKKRYKKDVIRNQDKYKQIRLNEKKKCLRKRKRAEKELQDIKNSVIEEGQTTEEFEEAKNKKIEEIQKQLDLIERDLDYTTYFPIGEKYISLYINNEKTEEYLAKIENLRQMVEKVKHRKQNLKKRDLKLADKVIEDEPQVSYNGGEYRTEEDKVEDNFFLDDDAEVEIDEYKRIVDRSGKIIKIEDRSRAKNYRQNEDKRMQERDRFNRNKFKGKKPEKQKIKIKARSYRVSQANLQGVKKKIHMKF